MRASGVRIDRMAPDVVMIDRGKPSRDTVKEMLTGGRMLAKRIAIFDGGIAAQRSQANRNIGGVASPHRGGIAAQ